MEQYHDDGVKAMKLSSIKLQLVRKIFFYAKDRENPR